MLLAVLAGIGWSRLKLSAKPWSGPAVLALAVIETLTPAARPRARPAWTSSRLPAPGLAAARSHPRGAAVRAGDRPLGGAARTPGAQRRGRVRALADARCSTATSRTIGWRACPWTWTPSAPRPTSGPLPRPLRHPAHGPDPPTWRTWPRPSSARARTASSRASRRRSDLRSATVHAFALSATAQRSFRRDALRDARRRAPGQGGAFRGHVVLGQHVRPLPGGQGGAVARVAQEPLGHLGEVVLVADAEAIGDGDPQLGRRGPPRPRPDARPARPPSSSARRPGPPPCPRPCWG